MTPTESERHGRLSGKVALITGAGEGIGRASALRFAREGARVGVMDSDRERADSVARAIVDEGHEALAVVGDVSDAADVRRAVHETVSTFGSLNVAFNNAGIWVPGDGAVAELDEQAWHRTIAVNLTGVFLCCRHEIPELRRAGGGSIINTSSPVAVIPEPVYDAYTASKGGVLSLTRSIAQYYGKFGIRANVLIPGPIETAMTRAAFEDATYHAMTLRRTPLGRMGRPEEVAHAALYLASDESSYVTGSIQWVDGGWALASQEEPPQLDEPES